MNVLDVCKHIKGIKVDKAFINISMNASLKPTFCKDVFCMMCICM